MINIHFDVKDPEKRRDVDEWLEWAGSGKGNWKTAIHLTIRFQILELLGHMRLFLSALSKGPLTGSLT